MKQNVGLGEVFGMCDKPRGIVKPHRCKSCGELRRQAIWINKECDYCLKSIKKEDKK